jgi:hypothetical protein
MNGAEAADNPLAHRVAVGKCLGRQHLIDDHAANLRVVIGFVERTAGDQRGAHGLEAARQHGLHTVYKSTA